MKMDVVNLIDNIHSPFGSLLQTTWVSSAIIFIQDHKLFNFFLAVVFLVAATVVVLICVKKLHKKAFSLEEEASEESITRFRKRDKALFYGRKMLRKVKNISGQGKKRKMMMKLARKILHLKKENDAEQLKVIEPPPEYLQEDMLSDDRMPPDALFMLQSIRVFGHFEKPVFLKLCKHTEILNVSAGSFLFKIGDEDENLYIVQSGKLNVYIASNDGANLSLKIVKPGESVTSLLSFTDVLTGHRNHYKTVSAKSVEDSIVVKLPMAAFQDIFQEYPDIFIRVVQVIMIRLQRVTFTALHEYLGLSSELFNQGSKFRNSKSFINTSPSKRKKEDSIVPETPSNITASQPIPVPHMRKTSEYKFSPNSTTPEANNENESQGEFSGGGHQRKRTSVYEITDPDSLINIATEAFIKELGLSDDKKLVGKIEIREITAGTFLVKEDSNKDVALVYIISGALNVLQRNSTEEEEEHLFTAYAGEVTGGLAVLTGEPSFFTVKAKHYSRVAMISRNTFYSLMKDDPKVVLYIANMIVKRLSPFVRQVDFALDWLFIESGRAIYRQDEESDSTYIVLSGRLRSVITHKNGKKELVGEYGKGDLIGVVEMVTHTRRSTTVMAVRDTELAKLPEGLFNAIKLRYPIVVTRLINLLGHRILGSWKTPSINISASPTIETRSAQNNFSTVAIIAASDDVPLVAFTYELYHCLHVIGPTLRLTSDVIKKTLGSSIMDPNNEYRLTSWLAQQEDQHKICLYMCDHNVSAWTQRCIRQADCILIVGLGDNAPTLGKVEKEMERLAMRTQKELVLLHREGGKPSNTVVWRNMRSWVSSHHHILCPNRMFSRKSLYRINELYSKVCSSEPNVHSDFSRLARWLTGKSVGLVLGGGGARGAAHIGMIKAIQEAGIPIDMVGGVSIGAFMGALWCQERNITTMTQKAREWSKKMTQWWRQLLDLTYPVTSMFSGKDFNTTIRSAFGETYIEDLWLPYFTVTTDITSSGMRVHYHGSLWRYVRASMSLSGYMPPLCDPVDGHLLLDGGYTNNLPADIMRSLGANHILAVDVGSVDDQDLTNYGDDLSGWWLLWKRWNPFTEPVKVPNLPDIQSRLTYVSCVRQLEQVKNSDYCEYIRPPIDNYRTLQFGSFDEIKDVGYQYGKSYFEGQKLVGNLPNFRSAADIQRSPDINSYTFTDLAQMVCKVSKPYEDESSSSSTSDDEYEDGRGGYASEPTGSLIDVNKENLMRRAGGSLSLSENEMESEVEFDLKSIKKSDASLSFK
ncbi:neuropathy target esterase sws isoform X1 [Coccinella septempunctata]|uniref:neuropathy target esterase sws isoform X1 n=1 Tax=Coccinella septempunctata TaxID=41139 RepID=UPI001D0990D4|nr:neuropathy target esterase sws isoform X1 [Coccinella septempunctata]